MSEDLTRVAVRASRPEDIPLRAALRYDFRAETDEPNESRKGFEARMVEWLREHLGEAWKAWLAFDDSEPSSIIPADPEPEDP